MGDPTNGGEGRGPVRGRRTRLTRDGAVVLLLALGFLAGALNTGTNLLYLLAGLLLNALALNAWLAGRPLRGLGVTWHAPGRVEACAPTTIRYELSREGRALATPVMLDEQGGAGRARVAVLPFAREGAVARRRGVFARIGWSPPPALQASCVGPFGLVLRWRDLAPVGSGVLALPPLRRLRQGVLGRSGHGEGDRVRPLHGLERRDLPRSLREYRAGDDPRAIHWRSSARRGALTIKEFERATPRRVLLLVELVVAGGEDRERARHAVLTLAASVFAALVRGGDEPQLGMIGADQVGLTPLSGGGERLIRAARERLARLEPAERADAAGLARLAREAPGAQRVLLVSSRAGAAGDGIPPAAQVLLAPTAAAAEAYFAAGPVGDAP